MLIGRGRTGLMSVGSTCDAGGSFRHRNARLDPCLRGRGRKVVDRGDVNATFFCAVCHFRVLAPGLPLVHGCSTIMVVIDGCTGKHSLIHALAETLTNVLMNSGAAVTR